MSFNRFMHPRNVFRNKPDYAELAKIYPEFSDIVIYKGKCPRSTLNYSDTNSLRVLTTTLLKHYFQLNVDIPLNRLIPAVPQRFNYILWIEDLMSLLGVNHHDKIIGIDIGTGACSVFPLLACSTNKAWSFIATEADEISFECAKNNVNKNNLQSRIEVVKVSSTDVLIKGLPVLSDVNAHFLMCNPPFFKEKHQKLCDTDTMDDGDSQSTSSTDIETVTCGGEVAFVRRLILESSHLKEQVKVYTVMLGHKSSVKELTEYLKTDEVQDIKNYYFNKFYQGKTLRWGLAWTFCSNLDLSQSCKYNPSKSQTKRDKILLYNVPKNLTETHYSFQSLYRKIRIMLRDELSIHNVDIIRVSSKTIEMEIRSNENTWSNQRRRRRMAMRKNLVESDSSLVDDTEKLNSQTMDVDSSECPSDSANCKRKLSDDIEGGLNSLEIHQKKAKEKIDYSIVEKDEEFYLLHCSCIIRKSGDNISIEMKSKDKTNSKEATHQLLQYLKNNIK